MERISVCILYGGKSGEHEVSLRSAASIVDYIDRSRYSLILIGIDKDGTWYYQPDILKTHRKGEPLTINTSPERVVLGVPGKGLYCGIIRIAADFVFPILHGTFGEDGTIQGFLETLDIPYSGAGVLGSSLGMDKEIVKKLWLFQGLPVVPFITGKKHLHSSEEGAKQLLKEALNNFGYPFFIKPARSGSSVGVNKVAGESFFYSALRDAFRYDTKVLVEPSVSGKEVECSVMGNHAPKSFCPGQIVPSHEFYDYKAKYIDPDGALLLIPADIDDSLKAKVQELAEKAYSAADTEGMARVDFFVEKDTDKIYLNEINTIPGFTNISMFPMLCEAGGLSYTEVITTLIELGQERHKEKRELLYSFSGTGENGV